MREAVGWLQANHTGRAPKHLASVRATDPGEKGLRLNTAVAYYEEYELPQALDAANLTLAVEPDAAERRRSSNCKVQSYLASRTTPAPNGASNKLSASRSAMANSIWRSRFSIIALAATSRPEQIYRTG